VKILFTADESQRKNLFDLCVGIIVLLIVVATFIAAPYTSNEAMRQYFTNQQKQ
jgi:hypothetical protein